MILTQAQAEAVYSAMCAMNNIGGTISASLHTNDWRIHVNALTGNGVGIKATARGVSPTVVRTEGYESQAAFASAYGMQ